MFQKVNWNFSLVYNLIIASFMVIMILLPKLIALPIIALAIMIIIGVVQKKMTFKLTVISFLFLALYAFYALYSIGSNHPELAASYLEYKMSFVLFPILFSFQLKSIKIEYPIIGLIIGSVVLLSYNLISSFICFSGTSTGFSCFLASNFSTIHHPTYTSVYYTFSLIGVIYLFVKSNIQMNKYLLIFLIFFFSIGTLLCLSLAGLLFFLGIGFGFSLFQLYKRFGKWIAIGFIALIPIIISIMIQIFPNLEGEYTSAKWYAEDYMSNHEGYVQNRKYPMSGSETRLVMWTVSIYEIQKHPFGVGTGNIDDHLSYQLNRLGQPETAEHKYNPHNQFLQTALEIGIPGLFILVLIISISILRGWKNSNWLLILLSLNLLFNCLFESMLQRQSGIVFYTFWFIVLTFLNNANSDLEKKYK